MLSGMRASVLMEEGKALDEEKLKAAFNTNKLELVSLEATEMKAPKAAYMLQASGTS
jgi:hypothetical protein